MIDVLRALSSCPPEYDELRQADAAYYVAWFREPSRGAIATNLYAGLLYVYESQSRLFTVRAQSSFQHSLSGVCSQVSRNTLR